jgi:lysophospholipase L1-like esterase
MLLRKNCRLLMIGDSITDCGRRRPIGQGGFDQALGNGYVSLVDAALKAVYPDYRITTINMGISGDTVHDLKYRWNRDVIDLEPDWLSILIGINDAWQHFNQLWQPGGHDPIPRFKETLSELLGFVQPDISGLVLLTPYYLESDSQQPMRELMDSYGAAVKEVAAGCDALLVDTQARFDPIMTIIDPLQLAMDRIHLNLAGHMILARAFLEKIDFSWERTLTNR